MQCCGLQPASKAAARRSPGQAAFETGDGSRPWLSQGLVKLQAVQTTCPHCHASLSDLASRAGAAHCGTARCRQAADDRRAAALRQSTVLDLLAKLPLPSSSPSPLVVWLVHHDPQSVPLTDEDRARHSAFLDRAIAQSLVVDRRRLAVFAADDSHPQGAQLCGQCRGRCCQHGADWHAFIDVSLLERWQQRPGAEQTTLADAAQAYVSMLPAQHAENGCLYQTEPGCALPREMRADICNGFACPSLQQVQRAAAADAAWPVLAIGFDRHSVGRAALITAHRTQTLLPCNANGGPP